LVFLQLWKPLHLWSRNTRFNIHGDSSSKPESCEMFTDDPLDEDNVLDEISDCVRMLHDVCMLPECWLLTEELCDIFK